MNLVSESNKIKRRIRIVWFLFLTQLPFYVILYLTISNDPLIFMLALTYFAVCYVTAAITLHSKCPNCSENYFIDPTFVNIYTKKCKHCGFNLYQKFLSTDFKKWFLIFKQQRIIVSTHYSNDEVLKIMNLYADVSDDYLNNDREPIIFKGKILNSEAFLFEKEAKTKPDIYFDIANTNSNNLTVFFRLDKDSLIRFFSFFILSFTIIVAFLILNIEFISYPILFLEKQTFFILLPLVLTFAIYKIVNHKIKKRLKNLFNGLLNEKV